MAYLPPQIVEYVRELESQDKEALVAVFDRDGFYLYASPNHEQALGYTSEDLQEMHLSQTVEPAQHHAAWVLRTVSVLYTEPIRFSSRLLGKSGELVAIDGTLRHIRAQGERFFVTCVRTARDS